MLVVGLVYTVQYLRVVGDNVTDKAKRKLVTCVAGSLLHKSCQQAHSQIWSVCSQDSTAGFPLPADHPDRVAGEQRRKLFVRVKLTDPEKSQDLKDSGNFQDWEVLVYAVGVQHHSVRDCCFADCRQCACKSTREEHADKASTGAYKVATDTAKGVLAWVRY